MSNSVTILMEPLEPRRTLSMEKVICVGFGAAYVSCDGETVWQEHPEAEWDSLWTVQRAEHEAMNRPNADWRIHIIGPLHEGHWQRQGVGEWVMYEIGDGFA